jgi:hypothetical protein
MSAYVLFIEYERQKVGAPQTYATFTKFLTIYFSDEKVEVYNAVVRRIRGTPDYAEDLKTMKNAMTLKQLNIKRYAYYFV